MLIFFLIIGSKRVNNHLRLMNSYIHYRIRYLDPLLLEFLPNGKIDCIFNFPSSPKILNCKKGFIINRKITIRFEPDIRGRLFKYLRKTGENIFECFPDFFRRGIITNPDFNTTADIIFIG